MMKRAYLVILLAASSICSVAQSAEWTVDYANSSLGFIATYEGVGFETRFEKFTADIDFEPADPAAGRFIVLVRVDSVNSRSKDRDEGMLGNEWFDAANHPEARFESTAFEQLGSDSFRSTGKLTIKGVTQTIELPFTWKSEGDGARLRAEATLQRTAFGIGSGEWASDSTIGFEVKVVGDLVLSR